VKAIQAIAKLKQELNINIELASPQDFLPPIPGWRNRSIFIGKRGQISFDRYDFTAQALSKLSRGFDRDLKDVEAMHKRKLFSLSELRNCFEAIVPELIRFPSLNPDLLRSKAATRLTEAGLDVPKHRLAPEPELTLYARFQDERDDPYLYYSALLNRLNSFCNALELSYKYKPSNKLLRPTL
jgi:hypothetical protein